jgi:hypothetical protein
MRRRRADTDIQRDSTIPQARMPGCGVGCRREPAPVESVAFNFKRLADLESP